MSIPKKPRKKCLNCHKEPARAKYKYCSNACQIEWQYHTYIRKWKEEKVNGLMCLGLVSRYIKKYLRNKYDNKCCLCGWSKVNSKTEVSPLVADHIDGNWRNNKENNLRLICPNCDSLLPTFAGLNRGKGRKNRNISARAREGHVLVNNAPK